MNVRKSRELSLWYNDALLPLVGSSIVFHYGVVSILSRKPGPFVDGFLGGLLFSIWFWCVVIGLQKVHQRFKVKHPVLKTVRRASFRQST